VRYIFIDTSYLKAISDRHDDLHERAKQVSCSLGAYIGVTSQMVLVELLNFLGDKGVLLRAAVLRVVDAVYLDPNTEVVPQTADQFAQALNLYRLRMDKGYSITDCASMRIMADRGLGIS